MAVALVCTWRPRGELPRVERRRPALETVYDHIAIVVPPGSDLTAIEPLRAWPRVELIVALAPGWGRTLALQAGLASDGARSATPGWLPCR